VGAVLRRIVRKEGTADASAVAPEAQGVASGPLPTGDQEALLREAIQDLEFSEDPVY
jgi:hypothetical protein